MIQEEVNQKTVALSVNTSKMTARLLLKMVRMYLAHSKNKKGSPVVVQGKQSLESLGKQNQGMTNIEITTDNIKAFEKYARKYGVDFALKKDKTQTPPKYMVFFKARDQDAIMCAFTEFSKDMLRKAEKPSVLHKLKEQKNIVAKKIKEFVKEKVAKRKEPIL